MFENKLTHNGIHYSRYIASWRKHGYPITRGGLFEKWLRDKEQLTEDEISDILNIAENGKLELEISSMMFVEQNKNESEYEKECERIPPYKWAKKYDEFVERGMLKPGG